MLTRFLFIFLFTASAFRQQQRIPDSRHFISTLNLQSNQNIGSATDSIIKSFGKVIKSLCIGAALLSSGPTQLRADDELAQYAAQGNEVGVDGQCFMRKCALETSRCANTPSCLKGLACLARLIFVFIAHTSV